MGVTWKYDTMFNSAFTEHNLQQLLYNAGVETIAIDYEPTDTYESLVEDIKQITPDVDYIMGYSFGCFLAIATTSENTKGIILLDPNAEINHNQKKYIEDIETANKFFERDLLSWRMDFNWSPFGRDLLSKNKNLGVIDKLIISPNKTKTLLLFSGWGDSNNSLCTNGMYLKFLGEKKKVVIKNSSHYIMLEPTRFTLAKEIMEFMNA